MPTTVSDVRQRAESIADELERASFNPYAVPPSGEEILDTLRSIEEAEPDDCTSCSDLDGLATDLLIASSLKVPSVTDTHEALARLLVATGVFDVRDADLVVEVLRRAK